MKPPEHHPQMSNEANPLIIVQPSWTVTFRGDVRPAAVGKTMEDGISQAVRLLDAGGIVHVVSSTGKVTKEIEIKITTHHKQ